MEKLNDAFHHISRNKPPDEKIKEVIDNTFQRWIYETRELTNEEEIVVKQSFNHVLNYLDKFDVVDKEFTDKWIEKNHIIRERVRVSKRNSALSSTPGGRYHWPIGAITIIPETCDGEAMEYDVRTTLRHELTHLLSARILSLERSRVHSKVGLDSSIVRDPLGDADARHHFKFLNEGITEHIARNSGAVYGKRGYESETRLFNVLVQKMSKIEGKDEKDITKDWYKNYFFGWSPEFKTRLRSVFGGDILKMIAILKDEEEVRALSKHL